MRRDVKEEYFQWMFNKVGMSSEYERLLRHLHSIDFYYVIPNDANRYEDGVSLRYRFGTESRIPDPIIATEIDIKPCSVLEMMTALALRIEETIMSNTQFGDRTHVWFWIMIENLRLSELSNAYFNTLEADSIIFNFLDRKYERNGKGGLFILNTKEDIRSFEIWKQAMWYLLDIPE